MSKKQLESTPDLIGEHVIMVIAGYLQRDATKIILGSRLVEDLGADSLEILEITLALNDYFDVEIPESELGGVRTTGDFCNLVKQLHQ
jgi:acyl carrier protein